jgi:hypothetical protein
MINLLTLRDSQSLQNAVDSALWQHKIPRRSDGRWDLIALDVKEKANELIELSEWLEQAERLYRRLADD